jgi:hypothetical protein
MINVVCVKTGDKFSDDYVLNLQEGVTKNVTVNHKFFCYTDKPVPGVECIELPMDLGGWWNKMQLFSPETTIRNDTSRYVYFDLDTLIVGNLDWLMGYPGVFAGIENLGIHNSKYEDVTQYKNQFQSGVMAFNKWNHNITVLWDYFYKNREHIMKKFNGDGEFLNDFVLSRHLLQDYYPGKITSYKYQAYEHGLPPASAILCFHGQPSVKEAMTTTVRPWGVEYEPREWVKDYWSV